MTDGDERPPRDASGWDSPDRCPFCGAALTDGGGGFIDHIEESPECEARFAAWRDRIRDDIGGEWSG